MPPEAESESWEELLIRRKPTLHQQATGERGTILAHLANAVTALTYAPEWESVLAFDEFKCNTVATRPTPWGKTGVWADEDTSRATCWLQERGINVASVVTGEAAQTVAMARKFHPVRDYLNGSKWDGEKRIANWGSKYLGAKKAIESIFAHKFLISAVARIMRPGCKVDTMLVLEHEQGKRKSTALANLVPQLEWFSDRISDFGTKDSLQECIGIWIIEVPEVDGYVRGRDAERIKAFMSSPANRFRLPYGRQVLEFPRECVFAGTTNRTEYLWDETGGRRFWPLRCGDIDAAGIAAIRDQLWAEAVAEYRAGEKWWLTTGQSIEAAQEEQAARYEGGVWDGLIAQWLVGRDDVSVAQILRECIGKSEANWTRADQMSVGKALASMGWQRFNARIGTDREWRYRRRD